MKNSQLAKITLHSLKASATVGILSYGQQHHICTVGKGGISSLKHEGDGATPRSVMTLKYVLYRPDRVAHPKTMLPVYPLCVNDGWCDEPTDANYNQPVPWPYHASNEHLWRHDHIYDVIVVLDYNLHPCHKHAGSAIFWHLSRTDLSPTQGCIAITYKNMVKMLERCGPSTKMIVR